MNTAPLAFPDVVEDQRLAALRRYDIAGAPADAALDRLAAMAARRFGVPYAAITLVDDDWIWVRAAQGIEKGRTAREPGLCAATISADAPHVLPDARLDPVASLHPMVTGPMGIRFYAGAPLTTYDGHRIGALCVVDRHPRIIDDRLIQDLQSLAALVVDQIELRAAARRSLAQAQLMAREIDHRVMNSLQFVSGLLQMQSREGSSLEDAARQLERAAGRVAAVAHVHRHCYVADTETTSCRDFLQRIAADLSSILNRPVEVEGAEGDVPTASIQSIGLLVNELVTNAAKYGDGRIRVLYSHSDGRHELCVKDEGPGLPADFDPQAGGGLGMKVVTALVADLGGKLSWSSGRRGSCFTIAFPQVRPACAAR